MLNKLTLDQILHFISKRWLDMSGDSNNKALKALPSSFWMNSVGGRIGRGWWITTIMYTENVDDAINIKNVLLRWQTKNSDRDVDLINIKKNEY